jgi:xanthine dehydrogenase YagS FAD-binding subunit
MRLAAAEAAAEGAATTAATIVRAIERSTDGAKPLPMAAYKLDLLKGLVQDLMERLSA